MQCELQLRFLELSSRRAVTIQTVDIDWCKPQFRIRGAGAALSPHTSDDQEQPHTSQTHGIMLMYSMLKAFATFILLKSRAIDAAGE